MKRIVLIVLFICSLSVVYSSAYTTEDQHAHTRTYWMQCDNGSTTTYAQADAAFYVDANGDVKNTGYWYLSSWTGTDWTNLLMKANSIVFVNTSNVTNPHVSHDILDNNNNIVYYASGPTATPTPTSAPTATPTVTPSPRQPLLPHQLGGGVDITTTIAGILPYLILLMIFAAAFWKGLKFVLTVLRRG